MATRATNTEMIKINPKAGIELFQTCKCECLSIALPSISTQRLVFCVIVMANSEGRGNMLASLTLASRHFLHEDEGQHDLEVSQGVAEGLATTLYKTLLLHQLGGSNYSRSSLNNMQALHIAVLSSSLAMVLRCSEDTLTMHVHKFRADLILSLLKLTEIFVAWDGDPTIRQVVLSSTTKAIGLIRSHVPYAAEQLLDSLFLILKGRVPSDIQIDAASAICGVFADPSVVLPEPVLTKIEENASLLISTLSTAALATPVVLEGAMGSLFKLAAVSNKVRLKMVKRRCTVIAVVKHLTHEDEDTREQTLSFYKKVLDDPECVQNLTSGAGENVTILAEGLMRLLRIRNEVEPLRCAAICLLRDMESLVKFPSESAMDTLRFIAFEGDSETVVIEAATAYCKAIQTATLTNYSGSTVVEFTKCPYAKVRCEALSTLERVVSSDETSASLLLHETDMLENFSFIVQHGSNQDRIAALDIARQLARSSSYHTVLCRHSGFLAAVIELVAKEKVVNDTAHFYGVETILALLSNEANTKAFMSFHQLLPWLVTFVNATMADDNFKKEIISAIVRLSTALLE
jgi:hypothetical protein